MGANTPHVHTVSDVHGQIKSVEHDLSKGSKMPDAKASGMTGSAMNAKFSGGTNKKQSIEENLTKGNPTV